MKNISCSEAINILSNCCAAIIKGTVAYPHVSEDPEEPFLSFYWEEDGYNFGANFYAGENETVKIDGPSMFLVDEQGDKVQVIILCKKNLD